MPVDYAKFDRLAREDEAEDKRFEEERQRSDEERARRDAEARRRGEAERLDRAEAQWRREEGLPPLHPKLNGGAAGAPPLGSGARPLARDDEDLVPRRIVSAAQSKAAGYDFESMTQEEIEDVDIDDFYRPLSEAEKVERAREKAERKERRLAREEAAGMRPLRDPSLSPEEVRARIAKLEADRVEMVALLDRSDRPAVKARLSEFVVELDNDLARLREDPLELDDEDRKELRLFHLRRWGLPGAARAERDNIVGGQDAYAPQQLEGPAEMLGALETPEPWEEISMFALDLGDPVTPTVTVDVRLEAVERLPRGEVSCHFEVDSFDLRVVHSLKGRRFRLLRTCLQRDIIPEESTFLIRRNHVVVTLRKAPGRAKGNNATEDRGASALEGDTGDLPWTDLCASDHRSRNPRRRAAPQDDSSTEASAPSY